MIPRDPAEALVLPRKKETLHVQYGAAAVVFSSGSFSPHTFAGCWAGDTVLTCDSSLAALLSLGAQVG